MTPSISQNNNSADVDVVRSTQQSQAAPVKENHETDPDPTVQDGTPLMWSEPVSSSQPIYMVTSDYDSADEESSGRGEALSPNSRPPSEAGFSVCSSSADVPVVVDVVDETYPPPPVTFLIPVFSQLSLGTENNNVVMYPPPQGMVVPQGGMPISAAPIQHLPTPYTATAAWSPPPENQQSVQVHHQQQGMVTYTSPPPQPPMIMPQAVMQHYQQPPPPPPHHQGQMMYTTPPPPTAAMDPLAHPTTAAVTDEAPSRSVTAMVMPMPETDRDGQNQISVGTRSGPMVLFATAPGASETTIQVQGMSGYPDSVSQQ